MRIKCPYCGERDAEEFAYLGAAGLTRPDPNGADAARPFMNTSICAPIRRACTPSSGITAAGCRSWLVVERDTRNHEIKSVALASPADGGAV